MKQHFEKQLDEMVLADIHARPYIDHFSVNNLKHYPTHLYKYRNCSAEHNFDMIEEGYLGKRIAIIGKNRYEWVRSYFTAV